MEARGIINGAQVTSLATAIAGHSFPRRVEKTGAFPEAKERIVRSSDPGAEWRYYKEHGQARVVLSITRADGSTVLSIEA